jgi:hypothetical protein
MDVSDASYNIQENNKNIGRRNGAHQKRKNKQDIPTPLCTKTKGGELETNLSSPD